MKFRSILILTLISISGISAQTVRTGLPFLKSGTDARSAAMGEAFSSVINDHASFFYNPAALRMTDRRQLSVGHREGFSDVTSDYLGATLPGESVSVGIAAMTTSVGGIEVRQRPGEPEGTFDARNALLSGGAAIMAADGIAAGIAGKLLYEKIYVDEASGYSFDAGIMYRMTNEIVFGAAILNVGTMSVLRAERSVVPASMRVGGSYTSSLSSDISVIAAADFVKTLDDNISHIHIGGELTYDAMMMIRAGYQTGYETRSISGGIGILYGMIRVDYAFVPSSGVFTPNHTVSLNFFL